MREECISCGLVGDVKRRFYLCVKKKDKKSIPDCQTLGAVVGTMGVWELGRVWELGSRGVWESGSLGVGESGSLGVGESGSWGVWESGSLGVGESGSWGVRELGSWGVGESGSVDCLTFYPLTLKQIRQVIYLQWRW